MAIWPILRYLTVKFETRVGDRPKAPACRFGLSIGVITRWRLRIFRVVTEDQIDDSQPIQLDCFSSVETGDGKSCPLETWTSTSLA